MYGLQKYQKIADAFSIIRISVPAALLNKE